jgi:hypothetical protein
MKANSRSHNNQQQPRPPQRKLKAPLAFYRSHLSVATTHSGDPGSEKESATRIEPSSSVLRTDGMGREAEPSRLRDWAILLTLFAAQIIWIGGIAAFIRWAATRSLG